LDEEPERAMLKATVREWLRAVRTVTASPLPDLDSEAINFRAAAELFAPKL
jgi:hypothetical protein